MFRVIRAILLLVIVGILVVIGPNRSFACFCVPQGPPAEELARSTAVFSGRAIKIEPSSVPVWQDVESVNVTFQVSAVWKGPLRETLTILTARWGIDCGYEFQGGGEYLVYALGTEDQLVVWFCSRTRPLAAAGEDLAALGAGTVPSIQLSSDVGVEVHTSANIPGKRETTQSFAYFVPWDWLWVDGALSGERVDFAFWNDPDKAPILSGLRWHGLVYGGLVKKGVKLALIEKIGNNARMTGPWEFGGDRPFRMGVDDQPLVAEMVESRVAIHYGGETPVGKVVKYTVQAGDTLGEIARAFGISVSAIAQANDIVNPDLIYTGQVLVIPQ